MLDGLQMDLKMAYFLLKAVQGKLNIVISGGTSSGKTTFLNAITRFIDEGDQLLTIEDTKEMKPQMPCHSIRSFEARTENEEGVGAITIEQLLRTALRSSPRRIIVGECRGPEIVTMLNAMNTGHPGSMTTVHADDTKEAIIRIENMFLEARPSANMNFVRSQIISAVDLVIQLVRFPDGKRRIVKISEPEKRMEENGIVSMLDIFEFKRSTSANGVSDSGGHFNVISSPIRSITKMGQNGIEIEKRIFDSDFVVTKEMVIDELKGYHPIRMCGWEESYMSEIIKNTFLDGKNILERWPNLLR
jgi:pilus assembly protein CpaF